MPLTATTVRNAKSSEKPRRIFDSKGLYLEVSPKGGKWWRLKYRFQGKEKRISLGVYPDVSLKEAREKRDDARKLLAGGIDPSAARRAMRNRTRSVNSQSFEVVAREWFDKFSTTWADSHSSKIIRRLERDIFPWLGKIPTSEIGALELLSALRRIEERGAKETAHRALQNCGRVFRYAIATGRATRDPSQDLRGALAPVTPKHHSSITDPKAIGGLLRAIDGYEGSFVTQCALRLAPLVFVRPGELRQATWDEIDIERATWRIEAERMKSRQTHIVPLANQAAGIFDELHPVTGSGNFVFPGIRSIRRPMSENTINAALRRLGYTKDEMTGHGFRSMASTVLNEQGWNHDAIERQLAHSEKNSVRAAYNYAEYLPERRKMMQSWADHLDALRRLK